MDLFPLRRMLKGKLLDIAELQDKLLIEMLSRFDIVLHGGTAIWRVYGGKRFSFDIDVYHEKPEEILGHFRRAEDFRMVKGKATGSGVVYMRFTEKGIGAEVDISPAFKDIKATDGEYHLVDGGTLVLKTLSPSTLLGEKIDAFRSRKKARDLYDIFYLLDKADMRGLRRKLRELEPLETPRDFSGLKEILLLGKVPDFGTITRKVRMYAKD